MKVYGIVPQPTADPRVFTLPAAPSPAASLQLFVNGLLQNEEDFELNGDRITFRHEPHKEDFLRAWYEGEV